MKMKMWIGNLDGRRAGLVIASSKERARKIVGTGRSDFDGHWRLQPGVDASLEVEKLYTRKLTHAREQPAWQLGQCPL